MIDPSDNQRLLLRVEPGQALVETLVALATAEAWPYAAVRASGSMQLVELERAEGVADTFEEAHIVSLSGMVELVGNQPTVKLHAMVLSDGQPHCGRVVAAVTGTMLLIIDAPETGPASRATMAPVGSAVSSAAVSSAATVSPATVRAPAPPAISTASRDGATVSGAASSTAAASGSSTMAARRKSPVARDATQPLSVNFSTKPQVPMVARPVARFDDEEEDAFVEPGLGEFLSHPQLGLCEVVGDDDSGGVRVRVPSGNVRVLLLDALRIEPGSVDEHGRTVYRVLGPRRR